MRGCQPREIPRLVPRYWREDQRNSKPRRRCRSVSVIERDTVREEITVVQHADPRSALQARALARSGDRVGPSSKKALNHFGLQSR
jgi:hypothetical protein